MSDATVNTDVPASVSPDMLEPLADDLSAGKDKFAFGVRALESGRKAMASMADDIAALAQAEQIVSRIERDGHGELSANLADAARAGFDRAAARVDASMRTIANAREAIDAAIGSALTHAGNATAEGITTANSIRAHVASLAKPSNRTGFVYARLSAGDLQTIDAVLRAPAYLSGLDDKAHKLLREQAASQFAPDLARQSEALDELRNRIESASSSLVKRYARVIKAPVATNRYRQARQVVAKIGGAA